MPKRKKRIGRPRVRARGPLTRLVFYLPTPHAAIIEQAATHVKMSISNYVGSVVIPVAMNALASVAVKSNAVDRIHQQVKVAEQTFDVVRD